MNKSRQQASLEKYLREKCKKKLKFGMLEMMMDRFDSSELKESEETEKVYKFKQKMKDFFCKSTLKLSKKGRQYMKRRKKSFELFAGITSHLI